jgi:serine/threonine protein kinase
VLDARYELERRIGGGGAATVYAARDRVLQRSVAVKVRRDDATFDHGGRFEQEARLLAGLSHPGLVTVYDAGTDTTAAAAPQAYLVMELVEGSTLAERLRSGPMSEAEAAKIGMQLAGALAYVHNRGIVHRDVKPANILLCTPEDEDLPTAKLTDFGIARRVDGDRMTMHGMTVGTANYLSPEQARNGAVGPPSDVYALGLVLLECLTGTVAFPGSGSVAAAARLSQQPVIPDELSPAWRELLSSMTAADPGTRPTATRAAAELARMRGSSVAEALPVAVAETSVAPLAAMRASGDRDAPPDATRLLPADAIPVAATRTRRPKGWWLLGGAAAAAVAAIISLALANRSSTSAGVPAAPPTTPAAHSAATTHSTTPTHVAVVRSNPAPAPKAPAPAPKQPKHHHGHGDG